MYRVMILVSDAGWRCAPACRSNRTVPVSASSTRAAYLAAASAGAETVSHKKPSAIAVRIRSEEHTSELQSLMRISYAVFCLKKRILTDKKTTQDLTNQSSIKITT